MTVWTQPLDTNERSYYFPLTMIKARSFVLLPLAALAAFHAGALYAGPLRTEHPLATTEPMRRWAAAHAPDDDAPPARIAALRETLIARGWRQRDDLTLSAAEAWTRREGDCVSFALLLVALSRSVGLEISFWLAEPLVSAREGDLDVARGHLVAHFAGAPGAAPRLFDAAGVHADLTAFRPITDRHAIAVFHSNRGAQRLLAGDWRGAERALEAATAIAADLAEAWSNLGVARSRLGDQAGAEAAYRRAIRLAPESAAGWRNLAILLERRLGSCPAAPREVDRF